MSRAGGPHDGRCQPVVLSTTEGEFHGPVRFPSRESARTRGHHPCAAPRTHAGRAAPTAPDMPAGAVRVDEAGRRQGVPPLAEWLEALSRRGVVGWRDTGGQGNVGVGGTRQPDTPGPGCRPRGRSRERNHRGRCRETTRSRHAFPLWWCRCVAHDARLYGLCPRARASCLAPPSRRRASFGAGAPVLAGRADWRRGTACAAANETQRHRAPWRIDRGRHPDHTHNQLPFGWIRAPDFF